MSVKTSSQPKGSPLTGNLTFYQNMIPALTSDTSGGDDKAALLGGAYRITIDQKISSEDGEVPEVTYSNSSDFTVRGPRFTLPIGLVSSVYPPEDAEGPYSNVLPHCCFTRGTFPWERGIGTATLKDGLSAESDQAPWVGILLAYEGEKEVVISQQPLSELLKKADASQPIFHPHFDYELGQEPTDQCVVVDLPIDLFNQIAPCHADLQWLGHVREIKPSNKQSATYLDKLKAVSSTILTPKLSTVISNRLPLAGAKNSALLVSYENWGPYLPTNDGKKNENIPAGATTIRLVLLKQWEFFTTAKKQTFAGYLTNLNKKDGEFTTSLLQLPTDEGTDEADKAINSAFKMGYVPLSHHTRQGADTVSWYKGPFLPYHHIGKIVKPVLGPDSCTAYNPDSGMFDVSYAAAWQLGRLLALQNGNFAEAIYNWKRGNTQIILSNFEEEAIVSTLKTISANSTNNQSEASTEGENTLQPELLQAMNRSLSTILSQFISNKKGDTNETK